MKNILIAGVGQIGSRYLQGLVPINLPLKIFCYDLSEQSFVVARERWQESGGLISKHKIIFLKKLENLPSNIDCAIISSGADSRLKLASLILEKTSVNIWILEKLLAQNIEDLDSLSDLLDKACCYVNTPLYLSSLYFNLREKFGNRKIDVKISGKRGIASNAIHFIDFVSRWNNSTIIYANCRNLKNW